MAKLALAAACAVAALAAAQPGAAYPSDALHRHGWSDQLQKIAARGVFWCMPNAPSMGQTGTISHLMPDVMTTPGGSQTVYFTARLEYWDGTKAVTVESAPKPWWYTTVSTWGPSYDWREFGTNRLSGNAFYWTSTWTGYWFRVHYYFYWGYDGTQINDEVSGWCQV